MNFARACHGLVFCIFFAVSYFTNKYVLSVLKFTYPTLFLGWQTCTGILLILVTEKVRLVEIKGFLRSATLLWLPGSVFFLGNIYAGSKALSILPIPFFFVFQNVSEVVVFFMIRFTQGERPSWMKIISQTLMMASAITLILHNPQFGPNGYLWASLHLLCIGSYRVFQRNSKSSHLRPVKDALDLDPHKPYLLDYSALEHQLINYMFSMLLLASAAHPTGDISGALEFPFLMSYQFYGGCLASAILGFLMLLASVKLKSGLPLVHFAVWAFLAKILASGLSIFIFSTDFSQPTVYCILTNNAGEMLSIYSDRVNER